MQRSLILIAAVTALTAMPVHAQQASQHGMVSQTVNETVITLEYDRPVARGRELFGNLIEWDAIWTPGANRATWIEFSEPVTFEGHALDAGRYGLWTVPTEDGPWEVIIVGDWDTPHAMFPFDGEVLRTKVAPVEGSHMEVLAFYFPVVAPYQGTLNLHWGTTILPLKIEVGR